MAFAICSAKSNSFIVGWVDVCNVYQWIGRIVCVAQTEEEKKILCFVGNTIEVSKTMTYVNVVCSPPITSVRDDANMNYIGAGSYILSVDGLIWNYILIVGRVDEPTLRHSWMCIQLTLLRFSTAMTIHTAWRRRAVNNLDNLSVYFYHWMT